MSEPGGVRPREELYGLLAWVGVLAGSRSALRVAPAPVLELSTYTFVSFCRNRFTLGQTVRMWAYWHTYRA